MLGLSRDDAPADARIFVGVIDPLDPRVESPEEVRDRVLEAAEAIPPDRLGSTDAVALPSPRGGSALGLGA